MPIARHVAVGGWRILCGVRRVARYNTCIWAAYSKEGSPVQHPDKKLPSAPAVPWHAQDMRDVAALVHADIDQGLHGDEARSRLVSHGANTLPQVARRAAWRRFLQQFHNPLIYVLLGAGIVTMLLEDHVDAAVILGVVLINACIGYIQEGKAERALDAVRNMLAHQATVLRGGERHNILAAELVPGDIVLLASGDRVPADLRLCRVKNLRVVEASLTGESLPIEKALAPVPAGASLGDRLCMAYSGTLVAFGQAAGIVVATGVHTELGQIGRMVSEVETLATPLTRRLDQFARQITAAILLIGLVTFLYGHYVQRMPAFDIFLAVVGLAVAAIPEGLPAVVTIVLAIGTRTLARNRAVIRRLPAVETLGSVSVICSDKTGTLTRNEMTAVRLMLADGEVEVTGGGYAPEGGFQVHGEAVDAARLPRLEVLLRCAMLCNDARLTHDEAAGWGLVGDPTEGALMTLAYKAGLLLEEQAQRFPRIDEIPFESAHRYMATLHHNHEGRHFILLKGAPERVLALCSVQAGGAPLDEGYWAASAERAASEGQRVLALAWCPVSDAPDGLNMSDITRRFALLGLVGIIDPARDEAKQAIAQCQQAGIRVKMITGDHVITAAAIGRTLGLKADCTLTGDQIEQLDEVALRVLAQDIDVIARASPEHKLRLVAALQAQGHQVAMTGDGVNDAPSLKAADIGVAMGGKGTDAAREAADLVLTDDNFATITRAVREGRVVYDNIKKSLLFMLPTNGGEAGVILVAVFAGLALPVTAGQILWVNTVTAVTLALALAFEPGERSVMDHPPRPVGEPLLTSPLMFRIIFVSALMVAVTFGIFEWELARGQSLEVARTAAVNMLVAGEMVYLFNVRHFTAPAWGRELLTGNPAVLWVCAVLIALQMAFTYAPAMNDLFKSAPLGLVSWGMIGVLATAKFLTVELEKLVWRRKGFQRM